MSTVKHPTDTFAQDVQNMTLALIAHDHCKPTMLEFARSNLAQLQDYALVGTGTTATLLKTQLGLDVKPMLSGPMGGDLQIGAMVAEGKIFAVIFLRDVMNAQPHEPDISALMRACDVHQVALATNVASAKLLLQGLASSNAQQVVR